MKKNKDESLDENSFHWSPPKVRTLLKCFNTICDKEYYEDILTATLIFFVKNHKRGADKNVSLEEHADDIKDNFLSLRKEMDMEGWPSG